MGERGRCGAPTSSIAKGRYGASLHARDARHAGTGAGCGRGACTSSRRPSSTRYGSRRTPPVLPLHPPPPGGRDHRHVPTSCHHGPGRHLSASPAGGAAGRHWQGRPARYRARPSTSEGAPRIDTWVQDTPRCADRLPRARVRPKPTGWLLPAGCDHGRSTDPAVSAPDAGLGREYCAIAGRLICHAPTYDRASSCLRMDATPRNPTTPGEVPQHHRRDDRSRPARGGARVEQDLGRAQGLHRTSSAGDSPPASPQPLRRCNRPAACIGVCRQARSPPVR